VTASARGLHGVWVNGVLVADATGMRRDRHPPGQVLRDFAA